MAEKKTSKKPVSGGKPAVTKKSATATAASKPKLSQAAVSARPARSSVAATVAKPVASKPPAGTRHISRVPRPNLHGHNGNGHEGHRENGIAILAEEELHKLKSGLNKRELANYRRLLLEKRFELVGDVKLLEGGALADSTNLSNMPLHMADVGSDNYEQEFTLGLAESERKLLREIDEALIRMQKGFYGICLAKGTPIGKPRLDAKPWAKFSIEVVREMERQGRRL